MTLSSHCNWEPAAGASCKESAAVKEEVLGNPWEGMTADPEDEYSYGRSEELQEKYPTPPNPWEGMTAEMEDEPPWQSAQLHRQQAQACRAAWHCEIPVKLAETQEPRKLQTENEPPWRSAELHHQQAQACRAAWPCEAAIKQAETQDHKLASQAAQASQAAAEGVHERAQPAAPSRCLQYGDEVLARWNGEWHPGMVLKVFEDTSCVRVLWDAEYLISELSISDVKLRQRPFLSKEQLSLRYQ
eukprot:TRINITY_DN111617_c0_g1_i1.p1 TRINITY_DN111617_c0_g1~~TRINITY_DN111617_c0_g1_i1.p1  ORF type:complete len:244 (-),score=53.88 TRINITY_DN111617_c0_g1_i1:97-828(-)